MTKWIPCLEPFNQPLIQQRYKNEIRLYLPHPPPIGGPGLYGAPAKKDIKHDTGSTFWLIGIWLLSIPA